MPRALFALPSVPRRLCLESVADGLILVPAEPGASLFHWPRPYSPPTSNPVRRVWHEGIMAEAQRRSAAAPG